VSQDLIVNLISRVDATASGIHGPRSSFEDLSVSKGELTMTASREMDPRSGDLHFQDELMNF
jgi:hypothetical protein